MAKLVMGIKEDTSHVKHWVLYISDQSLNSTETNITNFFLVLKPLL